MHRKALAPLVAASLALLSADAFADPLPAAPDAKPPAPAPLLIPTPPSYAETPRVPAAWTAAAPPPVPTRLDTYSGHILLADAASLALGATGVLTNKSSLTTMGIAGYFAGAPIVHKVHGRGSTALASVGLRVLAPLVTGAVGAGVALGIYGQDGGDTFRNGYAPVVGFALGGLVGIVAAPILDATVLARTEIFNRLPLVPQVSVANGGGSVGFAGVF